MFFNRTTLIAILVLSLSLNVFILGGVGSVYFLKQSQLDDDLFKPSSPLPAHMRLSMPPHIIFLELVNMSLPNLTPEGQAITRRIRDDFQAELSKQRLKFLQAPRHVLDAFTANPFDSLAMEQAVRDILNVKKHIDDLFEESILSLASELNAKDRQIISETFLSAANQ